MVGTQHVGWNTFSFAWKYFQMVICLRHLFGGDYFVVGTYFGDERLSGEMYLGVFGSHTLSVYGAGTILE